MALRRGWHPWQRHDTDDGRHLRGWHAWCGGELEVPAGGLPSVTSEIFRCMSTAPHGNVRGRWLFRARSAARTPASRGGGFTTIELVAVLAVTLVMVAVAVSA